MGHETLWNTKKSGEAKKSRDCAAEIGQDLSRNSGEAGLFFELRGALAPILQEKGTRWSSIQAGFRASAAVIKSEKKKVIAVAGKRAAGGRPQHKPMDSKTHRQSDRAAFWSALFPLWRMEADDGIGVEPSKAGAPGHRKGRRSHRPMEEMCLAPYKKKPKGLKRTWLSSMNRVSSSFLMCAGHGLRWVKPPFCAIATGAIKFPPFPASPFPQAAAVSVSTSVSMPPISLALKSSASSATSCAICAATSCSFGTEGPFTGAGSLKISFNTAKGFMSIVSLVTPRSSTRMSLFGQRPRETSPMARQEMSPSSARNCAVPLSGSAIPNGSYGLVSTLQSCRGNKVRLYPLLS